MVSEDVARRVVSYMKHQAAKPREQITDLVVDSQRRLLAIIEGVDDARASRPESPGEWSIRELTRHVIAAEEGVAGLIEALGRGATPRPRAGLGSMIPDNGEPFLQLVARLRDVNGRLLAAIRELPPEPDLAASYPHPFFGQLNCLEWAVFQRVHDEDHIRQAEKILAATS